MKTLIPFLSSEIERQLIPQIENLQESGLVTVWDPKTRTAAYVLVRVDTGQPPTLERWTVEGPISREQAEQAAAKIVEAARRVDLDPVTIN